MFYGSGLLYLSVLGFNGCVPPTVSCRSWHGCFFWVRPGLIWAAWLDPSTGSSGARAAISEPHRAFSHILLSVIIHAAEVPAGAVRCETIIMRGDNFDFTACLEEIFQCCFIHDFSVTLYFSFCQVFFRSVFPAAGGQVYSIGVIL